MSQAPVMELRDVSFAYRGGHKVVGGVSAALQPGKLHALIGPNAAGKSTLVKLMLDRLRPQSGEVLLGGSPMRRLTAARRAAWVSYVPQRSSAAFAFTVEQVVAMGRFSLPSDPAAVRQALDVCDLAQLTDRPFVELSVGQQQRVLLARAVAQAAGEGRAMLLDEPTSAMDLAHVHQTMRRLRDLAGRGLALLVVLQDLNLTARYADRVWLMSAGRLVADGPWQEVMLPQRLQEVYGVRVTALTGAADRPVFDVQS